MISRSTTTVVIAIATLIAPVAFGTGTPDNEQVGQFDGKIGTALSELMHSQPKAQFIRSGAAVNCIYGAAIERGSSPEQTAENFIRKYTNVFGADYDELTPGSRMTNLPKTQPIMYDEFTDSYKFTQVYYSQSVDGIPVFRSELRLLVRNGSDYPLVLAKSTLRDLRWYVAGGPRAMTSGDVAPVVRADNMYLEQFSEPEAVIWAGLKADTTTPRAAVTVYASNDDPSIWLYVIDAETNEILYKEDQVIFAQVQGDVSGTATEGPGADVCGEEVPTPLPYAQVEIGATSVYTDSLGHYDADVDIAMLIEVISGLKGQHFTVHNMHDDDAVLQLLTPGGEVDLFHNENNDDPLYLAQVNAYVSANRVRDFALRQNPSYPGVSNNLCPDVYVNRTDAYCPCNAWYIPFGTPSMNFCKPYVPVDVATCANTAFSSVIYHEYGHHLINVATSGQGMYGEGMADAVSALLNDDPRIGLGFFTNCNEHIRDADNDMQFPCEQFMDGDLYQCGAVLTGAIWDVRNELMLTYPSSYLDTVSRLTVNSILLHIGNLITPQIVIDFLTLDDDDTDISNGTPHMMEICAGFGAHNLRCPEFRIFEFVYSEELPEFIGADSNYSIQVQIIPRGANTMIPGTAAFNFAINGSDYQQGDITEIGVSEFIITFPEVSCGDIVDWYVSAESPDFGVIGDPYYYDTAPNRLIIAKDRLVIFEDDINENRGWTVEAVNNMGGLWERGIPITGEDVHGSPDSDYDGSGYCYLTDNAVLTSSLRHGVSSLISPNLGVLDGVARIEFARWWHNQVAGLYFFPDDSFRVQVSGDNGNTWETAEQMDPYYSDHLGGWFKDDIVPDDFVTSTTGTRIRFDAINYERYNINLVEAAIDDVRVYLYVCYDGLTIFTSVLSDATLGSPYSGQLEAVYGEGLITWSDKFGNLSTTGLSMSSTGLISGVPTSTGVITFTVLATDNSGQSDEKQFTIAVNSSLKLHDNFPDEWTYMCFYIKHFKVEGGTPPYTFSNPSGNLPTVDPSLGLIIDFFEYWNEDWGNVEDWGMIGRYTSQDSLWFTLAVEDQAGATDTVEVTIFTNDSLKVTTVDLPDAVAGVPYSARIEYQGGTAPLKWHDTMQDFRSVGLGLDSLTGEVSGIPDSLGAFECRIVVCDAAYCRWAYYKSFGHLINLTIAPPEDCGDLDLNGAIDISDLTFLIDYMFGGGPAPDPWQAADVNSTGSVDISDVTFMAEYFFAGGDFPHCTDIPD